MTGVESRYFLRINGHPRQFQTGMNIDAKICLADQSDNVYKSVVQLKVERVPQSHAKKGAGLYGPKQVIVTRHPPQVHAHPASAVGGAVLGGEEKTGDIV